MKIKIAVTLLTIGFLFTGCSFGTGVEMMMKPPKLSVQQEEISLALQEKAGKNIKLKFPKSGEYRSPILVANIDDEPTDEAIVFYERSGVNDGESNIRINVIDQKNNKWESVFDHSGGGIEIEKVVLSRIGESDKIYIIVGYTMINQTEKFLSVYSYGDGRLQTLFTDSYSVMEVMDINDDGLQELVLIAGNMKAANIIPSFNETAYSPTYKDNAAKQILTTKMEIQQQNTIAKVITCDDGIFKTMSETQMQGIPSDFSSIIRGKVGISTPALFVDYSIGDGQIQTQILYCSGNQIINPFAKLPEILALTTRPAGYPSMDIDSDGVVEIQRVSTFPGYEVLPAEDRLYMSDWFVFEQATLAKKSSGYYNINDGYCFMLPNRWQGTVTAAYDPILDEMVFYKYNGTLENSTKELMRIATVKKGENADKILDGYKTITTKGLTEYMVKIPTEKNEPLILTRSEISYNFVIL
ncbi:MAG: hypothetical protein RR540_02300 [Oscillospiraceae bacterium]